MSLEDKIKNNISSMQKEVGRKQFKVFSPGIQFEKKFEEILDEHSSGKLLDAGAGNLHFKKMLTQHCSEYESLDIIDNPELDYKQDLKDTDLKSGKYNTVFCRNVLEHVKNPQEALNEISRVLKKDGKVILSVPHLAYLQDKPENYYRFTEYGLEHMAEEADLTVKNIEAVGGLFSFLAFLTATATVGLTYQIPLISKLTYYLNYFTQLTCLKLDKATKNYKYLPFNYVMVAEK